MPTPRDKVDRILSDIREHSRELEAINGIVTAEIDDIRNRYADRIKSQAENIAKLEKNLRALVKRHHGEIMDGQDRAEFSSGSVIYKELERVKRIKGMLQRLKDAGLTKAIKPADEYVNWDEVEKFDDSVLERLGTERKKKTEVSYELK